MRMSTGFTLLEVMVALAVFALLSLAILNLNQHQLIRAGIVSEKLAAMELANQELSQLTSGESAVSIGEQVKQKTIDGVEYLVTQTAVKINEPPLYEVKVSVRNGDKFSSGYQLYQGVTYIVRVK